MMKSPGSCRNVYTCEKGGITHISIVKETYWLHHC